LFSSHTDVRILIRRTIYGVALGGPLCLVGRVMGLGFGDLAGSKAMITVVISGLVMVVLQFVIAKEWLREVRPAFGGAL
jgi:hypothetical protein